MARAGALAGALVLVAIPATAQTDASWSQFQGDAGHTGYAAQGPAPGYSIDWTMPVPSGGPDDQYGLSAPVVTGDLVVAVGPEEVIGVTASTGAPAWSVERDFGPSASAAIASTAQGDAVVYTEGFGTGPPDPGASSAAASEEPTATASASPSNPPGDPLGESAVVDSHLAAFDLRTRKPLWDPVPLDAVSRTGVTVEGSMAYLGVNGGIVYGIDLERGEVSWQVELGRIVATPIAVQDGTVLVGLQLSSEDPRPAVVALEAGSGEERWRLDDQGTAGIVSATSVTDGVVYAAFSGGQESSIDAIDLDSGERRWRTRFPRFFDLSATAPPVVTDDGVYATDTQGETYRLDLATGERTWEFALNQGVLRAAPLVVSDSLLVAMIDGALAALDTSTGDLVWRDAGDGFPLRALAVAGDRVVAVRSGAQAGLVAFAHDDEVALVRELSPTQLDPASLAGSFAAAAIAIGALVLLAGRLLVGRMGPAFADGVELEGARDANPDPDSDDDDDEGPDDPEAGR